MNKTLYFEGAGWSGADTSKETVGNCRIRTAFHLDDGRAVYLEICASRRTKHSPKKIYKWEYTGFIDTCHFITDDTPNDDCSNHNIIRRNTRCIEYTEAGILKFVNKLGASFDSIKVLPDLGGYQVFPSKNSCCGTAGYYYGDEFEYDPNMIARRETVYNRIYAIEVRELEEDYRNKGGKFVHSPTGFTYPNFSMWVDEFDSGELHLLRHFNGYNKHWTIRTDVGDTIEDWMASMTESTLGRYGC